MAFGNLLDESFEGSGYENSWIEEQGSGSVIDEDNTDISPPSGVGAGSQILKIQKVSPNYSALAKHNLASEESVTYSTFFIRIEAEGLDDNDVCRVAYAEDGSWNEVWTIMLRQESGTGLFFRFRIYNNGNIQVYDSSTLNTGTWYRVDVKYNDSDNTWEWRIDEVSQDSGSLTGTHRTGIKFFRLGSASDSEEITIYFDLAQIDSSAYVTLEQKGDLLDESFEGSGYEHTWTEVVGSGSVVDEDNTDISPPTNGGSQILKIQKVSPNYNTKTWTSLGSEYSKTFSTIFVNINAISIAEWDWKFFWFGYDASWNNPWCIAIERMSGTNYRFRLRLYNNGGYNYYTTSNISFDTWYRIDVKYDDVANTWEWRLNEASQDSGSLTGTHLTGIKFIQISEDWTSYTTTQYFDLCQVDSSAYVSWITVKNVSDLGSGAETIGIKAILSLSDVGSGVDAILLKNILDTISDNGSGEDAISKLIKIAISDSGSGADLIAGIKAILSIADTGIGQDLIALIKVLLTITDSGSGAESVTTSQPAKFIQDSGSGQETISIKALLTLLESGSGLDLISIKNILGISDSGAGEDLALVKQFRSIADSGLGQEILAIKNMISLIDTGLGTEAFNILAKIAIQDAGTAADIVSVFTGTIFPLIFGVEPRGRVFDLKARGRIFKVEPRERIHDTERKGK